MALLSLPTELLGVLIKNPATGKLELPENATDEQKKAFFAHQEAVKSAQNKMCEVDG